MTQLQVTGQLLHSRTCNVCLWISVSLDFEVECAEPRPLSI